MRTSVSLNGDWQFMPRYGVRHDVSLPDKLIFESTPVYVPSSFRARDGKTYQTIPDFAPFRVYDYPDEWSDAETGVLRRCFSYQKTPHARTFLKFHGLMQLSAIYLNGALVATHDDSYLPLTVEITDSVQEENELIVVVSDYPKVSIPSGEEKCTHLIGSWWGTLGRGIWQDVELLTLPEHFIESIETKASVREHTLTVLVRASKTVPVTVTVGPIRLSGQTNEAMHASWENPILWDIHHPHLYEITATTETDSLSQPFGFREFWCEADQFYLNGTKINLRGESWHFQGTSQQTKEYAKNWFRTAKSYGLNFVRLHAEPHPEYYLDAADEVGILLVSESAIYGSGKTMAADHPDYIAHCKEHVKNWVLRDRRHPSVVIWSLENEMRWVDGRDGYKKAIPELLSILRATDPETRLTVLEGDNRLYPKHQCDIESYHYNIDGTIEQWDRTRPLMFGEHGGSWYLCPQNASPYVGLSAYSGYEGTVAGIAEKERLFLEYCRREKVSALSVFNFAHYYGQSMPKESVTVGKQIIPKYALTINNGLLPDYPAHIPNIAAEIVGRAMKEATVIPAENDRNLFCHRTYMRRFTVYNDTRESHAVRIEWNGLISHTKALSQEAGTSVTVTLPINSETAGSKTLNIRLYHDNVLVDESTEEYCFWESPSAISTKKRIAYYGNHAEWERLNSLLPCTHIASLSDLCDEASLLILGEHLPSEIRKEQETLRRFTEQGGTLLVLAQDQFILGDLHLSHQGWFGVHRGGSHPITDGLSDRDFLFWEPDTIEGTPKNIVNFAYTKPIAGHASMVLECSLGDFGNGGDLWAPLLEIASKKGTVILCQLELGSFWDMTPMAREIASRVLRYAEACEPKAPIAVRMVAPELLSKQERNELKNGTEPVILLPSSEEALSDILDCDVHLSPAPTYHLTFSSVTGLSPTDGFAYEKVPLSPRQVTNDLLAEYALQIEGGEVLSESVTGTPFTDYYVNGQNAEYSIPALASLCRDKKTAPLPYIVKKGRFLVSSITPTEKHKRIYDCLAGMLGADVPCGIFEETPSKRNEYLEYMMVMPHFPWQSLPDAEQYYFDPMYSLNNLGEGLYGWMKKMESDQDGYISFIAEEETTFVTAFLESNISASVPVRFEANCDAVLKISGIPLDCSANITPGIHPIAIKLHAEKGSEVRFQLGFDAPYRFIFRTVIDEVDPK